MHFSIDKEDFDEVFSKGLWDYMCSLKNSGLIRHLGFSFHQPGVSRQIIDTGLVDMIMFSINPAYDYKIGEYDLGETVERAAFSASVNHVG